MEGKIVDKYRTLKEDDYKYIEDLHKEIKKSKYRQKFHIQPMTGLLNDPNGFHRFSNKYYLYHQWYPFDSIHGMKHWYLMESEDLVRWKRVGVRVYPDTVYDNKGVYSGSSIVLDSKRYAVYTGNHRDDKNIRHPYQILSEIKEDGSLDKKTPIIEENKEFTEHQRDPMIFRRDDKFYIVIGVQDHNLVGGVALYEADSIDGEWSYRGKIKVKGYENFGYMWECPSLIEIDGYDLLVFSPQGLKADGDRYNNIYQNGYLIGKMDFENLVFTHMGDFEELDRGFDFYATQLEESTKNIIGWMGLPDSTYYTDKEKWSGCMSMVRNLEIKNGRLIQNPPKDQDKLRKRCEYSGKTKEISLSSSALKEIDILNIESDNIDLRIYTNLKIEYSGGFLSMDRSKMNHRINPSQGEVRRVFVGDLKKLKVYVDSSSVELFINDGEYTMTARVFPSDGEEEILYSSSKECEVSIYDLYSAIEDNFVL